LLELADLVIKEASDFEVALLFLLKLGSHSINLWLNLHLVQDLVDPVNHGLREGMIFQMASKVLYSLLRYEVKVRSYEH